MVDVTIVVVLAIVVVEIAIVVDSAMVVIIVGGNQGHFAKSQDLEFCADFLKLFGVFIK